MISQFLFKIVFIALLLAIPRLALSESADLILIEKAKRQLTLMKDGVAIAHYRISLGGSPVGPKRCEGDQKTPEGEYEILARNIDSKFHKSLKISYPSGVDRKNAAKLHCSPGGDIMIHGLPNGQGWLGASHHLVDWTIGCVAVTNSEIDEIWEKASTGTRVRIVP